MSRWEWGELPGARKIPRHYSDEDLDLDECLRRSRRVNSSPLIHLSMVGRISLIRRFSSIYIPPAVWQEVVEQGGSHPGADEIRDARESGWLQVIEPSDKALVLLLKQELHSGEAESTRPCS